MKKVQKAENNSSVNEQHSAKNNWNVKRYETKLWLYAKRVQIFTLRWINRLMFLAAHNSLYMFGLLATLVLKSIFYFSDRFLLQQN